MASNYDDVIAQLECAGLQIDHLVIGRMTRVKIEGDRERRGWYALHEVTLSGGESVIVGTYGVWRGDDNGAQKITLTKHAMTPEQKAAIRARLAEDKKRADQIRGAEIARAAQVADRAWRACIPTGESDYLIRKGVRAHGVRFSPKGAMVIPMMDTGGRVFGLQFILSRSTHRSRIERTERDKEYWPPGLDKKGHFHLIGGTPTWCLLLAEGYATAASLHEATGLPVAIAFDAGNLLPVAQALHKRYRSARILVCADDDAFGKCDNCKAPVRTESPDPNCPACGEPHRRENAGVLRAEAAALAVGGQWVRPVFPDADARWPAFVERGTKITDFNDLHLAAGLPLVRQQIEDAIRRYGWAAPDAPRTPKTGGAGSKDLKPFETTEELLERFSLVYGQGGTVFDHAEHQLLGLSDMRDACMSREIHRRWQEHPERRIVRVDEVGFDPAGDDPRIKCNLWAGWPTVPKAGKCEDLLDLLRHMCAADAKPEELYQWVLRWLAYPIQHPGAKMKTAIVMHGPQGTGKNMFFEAVMQIYGRYGWVIDQSAIEDKFNDWASRKLFLIADEVVARSEMFHIKNKLKSFVTGEQIRINPKNMAAYWEANHVNLVFLSNERMPVVLEEDDRRHAVIWTPTKLGQDFYAAVYAELRSGGSAALHDYLLHLPLGDFAPHTLPPMTEAKAELIELSRDSTTRFALLWLDGLLDGVPLVPAPSEDVYALYQSWCQRQGIGRAAPLNKFVDALLKKHGFTGGHGKGGRKWCQFTAARKQLSFVFPPGAQGPGDGRSEAAWLGDCVEKFRNAVSDLKGASHGGF